MMHHSTRRKFLASLATAPAIAAPADRFHLIAHRGGIVGEHHAENSPASVQAAIERGYWMIEVDIRRSRDGHPVIQHDPDFRRYYGDPRAVSELSWSEMQRLRANPGSTPPLDFKQLCEMCAGRIRLMLDIKGDDHPDEFYAGLERTMRDHDLLRTAYTLGGDRIKSFFRGKLLLSAQRDALRAAAARGEDVAGTYFLFELGSVLDREAVDLCRRLGVTPVAALNTFRYEMEGIDHWKGAERDAVKLRPLGVRHYQIDSLYDRLFV